LTKALAMDIPDEEVKNIINDDGHNVATVLRCMRGSTALVAITDPSKSNLWVASLGDSAAGTQIRYSSEKVRAQRMPFPFSSRNEG
jgi:pyruvate dehydrogenase phosphatase